MVGTQGCNMGHVLIHFLVGFLYLMANLAADGFDRHLQASANCPITTAIGILNKIKIFSKKVRTLSNKTWSQSYETLRGIIRVFFTSKQCYNTHKNTRIIPRRVS